MYFASPLHPACVRPVMPRACTTRLTPNTNALPSPLLRAPALALPKIGARTRIPHSGRQRTSKCQCSASHRLRLNACKSSTLSNSCSVRLLAQRTRAARTRVLKILTVRCRAPQLAFLGNSKKWLAQKKMLANGECSSGPSSALTSSNAVDKWSTSASQPKYHLDKKANAPRI